MILAANREVEIVTDPARLHLRAKDGHATGLQFAQSHGGSHGTVHPKVLVELAIDGKNDWRPLAPHDGVFDSLDESVDVDISGLVPPGVHTVVVRAFDAAANAAIADSTAK